MSMDEFIASIWNAEEIPPLPVYEEAAKNKSVAPEPTIPQPGSFSVPPPICKKTVDEVWSQIQKSQPKQHNEADKNETLEKQPTFGEITLEEFLVKAGVVRESTLFTTILPQNNFGNIPSNVPFNTSYILIGTTGSNVPSNRFEPHPMLPQNNTLVLRNLPTAPATHSQNLGESSGKGKKRIISGPPEEVIERRQRRMLKNRESAARSRARRQAYTVELEAELNHLKDENEKLKTVLAADELKRKEAISQRKPSTMAEKRTEKLKKLKRAQSATW
ncbi:ABSCISIC ACID-INSENSITIVE 5-like protein 1 isoform X2 [Phaseolus vulgaris]